MRRRASHGFTVIELMIVVAIGALLVALAYPSWRQMNDNNRLRTAARATAQSFGYAREQAMRTGRRHILFSQTGPATDNCGQPIPAPLLVLDDANANCCIDAGEPTWSPEELSDAGVQQTAFWGVTNATVRVPEDSGAGGFTTGATFTRPTGAASAGTAFRGDGVPVGMSTACVLGQVGSGSGAFYFTNGRPGLNNSERRDYAVVLTPLGGSKVFTWDAASARWSQ